MRAVIQSAYWLLIILSCAGLSHLRQPITDMLSNFYLHFAVAGAVLFIVGLHWRLPRTAIVSVAISIICFALSFSYDKIPAIQSERDDASSKTYRLMTFNAWERAKTMSRLKTFLRKEKPDFVMLQEITVKDWRSLKSLSDLYPYMSYCDDWLCGVALLSRHKWHSVKAENFGPHQLPLIVASFNDKFNGLRLYATHTARPHWKYSTQREQLEYLAGFLSTNSKRPTLLGGDMNATVYSSLLRDFTSSSSLKPAGPIVPTWPQRLRQTGFIKLPLLQLDIDHIFVKPGMKILRKWRGPDLGSDHRPLLVDFKL